MSKSTEVATVRKGEVAEGAEQVSALMKLALEHGHPVEVLNQLFDLQVRVDERNARAEFFDALARFQEEVPSIHKGQTARIATKAGGSYSYTFAPLDAIAKTIREPLRKHGFSYGWTVQQNGDHGLLVECILRHKGGHEERASFPVPVDTAAAMSGAQKNGAALTYGKRQSLTSVLGLTTTDDDTDGEVPPTGPITAAQLADLEALIEEVGADRAAFVRWLKVENLSSLPQYDLPRAIKALEDKRSRGKA